MKNSILTIILICTLLNNINSQPLNAEFDADIKQGCKSILVNFTNNSTPATGLTYFWDFGNGFTSVLSSPTVAYTNAGTFDVLLVISDGINTDSIYKEDFIRVLQAPKANIIATGDFMGCAPNTIQFEDNTKPGDGTLNTWIWDFGDGYLSYSQSPTHIYTHQNDFAVTLTVVDDNNCNDFVIFENTISVHKPIADFSVTGNSSCSGQLTAVFQNFSKFVGSAQ